MRPTVNFLNVGLIINIIHEAYDILENVGVEINNQNVIDLLGDHPEIKIKEKRVFFGKEVVRKCCQIAPPHVKLFNANDKKTHDLCHNNVYFTPGSAALNILDPRINKIRKPTINDYIKYAKIIHQLNNIESQSTAIIPSDVPGEMSDSYRLYLSLLYCDKPVVTGMFSISSFYPMLNMQLAIRGNKQNLKEKPLTIFSICPTSPLKWSDVTSQNLLDCAEYGIPVEFISMPLSGFVAPATLVGTLIQHTAETMSGIVIGQLKNPGTPMLYGGSPAIFDCRYETTPMGAIETMMIDCAYNQIGKYLEIPTQAYTSFSDSKRLDTQAGIESGIGAVLGALAGINNMSGPGMLDFESCQSLEKLVIDNEICGMAKRLIKGIEPKDDFPSFPIFQELVQEKNLIISDHTIKHIKEEHFSPGPVIDRKNLGRWRNDKSIEIGQRANKEVNNLIDKYDYDNYNEKLDKNIKKELNDIIEIEGKKYNF
jgi:trimethylamine---corrinoid protein Co-methyltransferase